jgi:hypothetical protein
LILRGHTHRSLGTAGLADGDDDDENDEESFCVDYGEKMKQIYCFTAWWVHTYILVSIQVAKPRRSETFRDYSK